MKRILFTLILICLILTNTLQSSPVLKKVDQWKLKETIAGKHFFSLIDKDNQLISSFYKMPFLVISRDKIFQFAQYGLGPSEIINSFTDFLYKGDLAIMESQDKLKIFAKKNGNYSWKETKRIKRSPLFTIMKSALFVDEKFVFAGIEQTQTIDAKTGEFFQIKICDDSGKIQKYLLPKKSNFLEIYPLMLMNSFLVSYKDQTVFFLKENQLKISEIDIKNMRIVREKVLEIPKFYKKMPDNFYIFKKYDNPKDNFILDIETWQTSYSAITAVAIDRNNLVIQVRIFEPEKQKFALLFYNITDLKLVNTILTDDLLLDIKDGKYYCFAGGDPVLDQDGEGDSIINIYSLYN